MLFVRAKLWITCLFYRVGHVSSDVDAPEKDVKVEEAARKKTRTASTLMQTEVFRGFKLIELYGDGDCGYRALGYATAAMVGCEPTRRGWERPSERGHCSGYDGTMSGRKLGKRTARPRRSKREDSRDR